MLKNAPFLITIGVDTAENEPRKESWVVATTEAWTIPEFARRRGEAAEEKPQCSSVQTMLARHADPSGLIHCGSMTIEPRNAVNGLVQDQWCVKANLGQYHRRNASQIKI